MIPTSTSLETLETHIHRLELDLAERKRNRNSCLPIAKFPDEVLSKVFEEAREPMLSHVPFGLRAGQVCHRWRGLVYRNPLFWANIQVRKDTGVGLLDHMLKSAKEVPLSLGIVSPKSPFTLNLLGETMKTHTARIQSLSIRGPDQTFSAVLGGPCDGTFPRLEILEASGIQPGHGQQFHPISATSGLQSISAPNIRRIKLGHGGPYTTLAIPWRSSLFARCANLTHLRAIHTPEVGSVRELKDLLRAVPQLQELRIVFDRLSDQTFDLGEPDASQPSRIYMPCLRALHLQSREEWTPAVALLDGMLFELGALDSLSLKPCYSSQWGTKLFVDQWWLSLRNACAEGEVFAPKVLRLMGGESQVEAWREVEDASKGRWVPWVLRGVDDESKDSFYGGWVSRLEIEAMEMNKPTPWINLRVAVPEIFSDESNYQGLWSFSSLKILEFGRGTFPEDLWKRIEQDGPLLEVIAIRSGAACAAFYSAFQDLLKLGAGHPYPALKKLSLQRPQPQSYGKSWEKGRKAESSFKLPDGYCLPTPLDLDGVFARGQLITVDQYERMQREEREQRELYEEGEFMLDFADALWERKESALRGGSAVARRDFMLETLQLVGFKQGAHEEVRRMILDCGVVSQVVFL